MSVERTTFVDAVSVRDGWAVVSIHEFGEWSDIDDAVRAVGAKLDTCFAHVASPHFQEKFHRLPVRVELSSRDPVPPDVRAFCDRLGVDVLDGT